MSKQYVSCDGIQELVDALETSFSNAEIEKMQKKALEPIAKEIKEDIKSAAPVCDLPEVHGRDQVGFRYVKSRGYHVGLDNQMEDNATHDYWNNTLRGLWFQEFKMSEPNYGWFTNIISRNADRYLNDALEDLSRALMDALNKK